MTGRAAAARPYQEGVPVPAEPGDPVVGMQPQRGVRRAVEEPDDPARNLRHHRRHYHVHLFLFLRRPARARGGAWQMLLATSSTRILNRHNSSSYCRYTSSRHRHAF